MTLQSDGSFAVVSASLDTDSSPYIAVPSRAYATSADKSKKPLSGVRVTVKDIYHCELLVPVTLDPDANIFFSEGSPHQCRK